MFEWQDNPEKSIADSTKRLYQQKLNTLSKSGYKNRNDLLNNATAIVSFIDTKNSRQTRSLYYAAIFYILGRVDFDAEPRAKPFYEAFQKNYYK